ncbi:pyridoxamine 5'-phosphate oxidase family protein [Micromonospora sp. B9E7]|uniref:pyridoxamine 5'-phosphate oxidase family protein n=1 Tax=Micromonospora sp. B9E7 TaxID=3153574 RepID=UPI00325C512D
MTGSHEPGPQLSSAPAGSSDRHGSPLATSRHSRSAGWWLIGTSRSIVLASPNHFRYAISFGGLMKPSERIDRRYSDDEGRVVPWADAEARLAATELAWVVTVRPDGRPHATPMVPVFHDGKVYFHTGSKEVKYANIQANPQVLVLAGDTAWQQGLDVAVEGTAVPVTDDALLRKLAELYRDRWDGRWQLDIKDGAIVSELPDSEVVAFEVTPNMAFSHSKGDPFSQTNYRL